MSGVTAVGGNVIVAGVVVVLRLLAIGGALTGRRAALPARAARSCSPCPAASSPPPA
jgi:hypothetical protein